MTTRKQRLARLIAERNAPPTWWRTPDPDGLRHREELAVALAGWRDPDYERRTFKPTPAEKTGAFIEDVEWMLRSGETAGGVCQRIDSTPAAIARRLDRAGRNDLARPFYVKGAAA